MKNIIIIIFLSIFLLACQQADKSTIDRKKLVNRHNVILNEADNLAPLSVGNGKFCYTADITGMQSFPEYYQSGIPLSTMSEWGWHSFPNTEGYKLSDTYEYVDTYGRKVPYPLNQGVPGGEFLRANPHQLSLALVGLKLKNSKGEVADISELKSINQELNVWKGILTSRFEFEGKPVEVVTVCHPDSDQLSFKISSPLFKEQKMAVQIFFPGASMRFGKDPAEFGNSENHSSEISSKSDKQILFSHQLDNKLYYCGLNTSINVDVEDSGNHIYVLSPQKGTSELSLSIDFSETKTADALPGFENTFDASVKNWETFWKSGAAVDLSQSTDSRWKELERRIVLSQYLTAIQSRQKYPPQETGLTFNSWYGKFHLEMHWWHSVHFALWNRLEWLELTLPWYEEIYEQALGFTKEQGYNGVRWPKMIGPDGIDVPSSTGPLLIWQQPHPIYYAELIYRQRPTSEVLEKYNKLINETAEFMADFAVWSNERKCYVLGPPLKSAREFGNLYNENLNPTFELAYWSWGLKKANEWRERHGQERISEWDKIADNMAPWPIHEGVYVEQEAELVPDGGHPCQLAAYGFLPESEYLDKEVMRKTLNHVMDNWDWSSTWGWDYSMVAMTAARLNEPQIAVDALLKEVQKNTYLPNGHNYQDNTLPIYLPGNGGLLTAVAMMCAGWDGSTDKSNPGFPDDGSWVVKWEGLQPLF
jgi:hypothetical protein